MIQMLSEQAKIASILVTLVTYTSLNLTRILMNVMTHIFQWRQFGVDRAFKIKYIGKFNIKNLLDVGLAEWRGG